MLGRATVVLSDPVVNGISIRDSATTDFARIGTDEDDEVCKTAGHKIGDDNDDKAGGCTNVCIRRGQSPYAIGMLGEI